MEHVYKKIMVAVDGSKASEIAFQKAINISLRNQSTLFLAHVIDTRAFQSIANFDSLLIENATQAAQELLDSYKQQAITKGCHTVHTIVEYGSPKPWIAKDLPVTHQIDLIVLGATGLNAVERFFIGSVSEYVVRHALCDVSIIRTDENNHLPTENTQVKK